MIEIGRIWGSSCMEHFDQSRNLNTSFYVPMDPPGTFSALLGPEILRTRKHLNLLGHFTEEMSSQVNEANRMNFMKTCTSLSILSVLFHLSIRSIVEEEIYARISHLRITDTLASPRRREDIAGRNTSCSSILLLIACPLSVHLDIAEFHFQPRTSLTMLICVIFPLLVSMTTKPRVTTES